MAHDVTILSSTDFRLNNHYCYQDSNGNWLSNPPLDLNDSNLMQTFDKVLNDLKNV